MRHHDTQAPITDETVPDKITRKIGIQYLTQCCDRRGKHWSGGLSQHENDCATCDGTNYAGWLGVPGGRYGGTSADCAPVAWRLAYLWARESGEGVNLDMLDHAMSLVVNSSDSVAAEINEYGHGMYR